MSACMYVYTGKQAQNMDFFESLLLCENPIFLPIMVCVVRLSFACRQKLVLPCTKTDEYWIFKWGKRDPKSQVFQDCFPVIYTPVHTVASISTTAGKIIYHSTTLDKHYYMCVHTLLWCSVFLSYQSLLSHTPAPSLLSYMYRIVTCPYIYIYIYIYTYVCVH